MNKRVLKYVIIVLLIGSAMGVMVYNKIIIDSAKEKEKNRQYVEYFEKQLLFDFSDYVSVVKGEIVLTEYTTSEGLIAMIVKVNAGAENDFLNLLEENCIKYDLPLPSDSLCPLVVEFDEMDIKDVFHVSREGRYAKTKIITIHVAYEGEVMYAFFWG